MRCDLSSVQQHVRVDHVHVEERCAQYKLVPSSTSGDSTLQAQAILLKRVAPLLTQNTCSFLHCDPSDVLRRGQVLDDDGEEVGRQRVEAQGRRVGGGLGRGHGTTDHNIKILNIDRSVTQLSSEKEKKNRHRERSGELAEL